jgi:hypothetical protein
MGSEVSTVFSHVYWIGGSPCSGKSSIVARLAQAHPFRSYNCDDAFRRHGQQVTFEDQPTFYKVMQLTWDEIWARPVEVLLADILAVYDEEFPLILRDLAAMPSDLPTVAEGAALMPHLVRDVLPDPRRAIWVVPTAAFQRQHYLERGPWVREILGQCADPERAYRNWMDRDAAYARTVAREAEDMGFAVLEVDDSHTITENAAVVARHLGLP